MLKAFDDYAEENFKKACYGLYADETTRARIDEQLAEKTEIVKNILRRLFQQFYLIIGILQ